MKNFARCAKQNSLAEDYDTSDDEANEMASVTDLDDGNILDGDFDDDFDDDLDGDLGLDDDLDEELDFEDEDDEDDEDDDEDNDD